VAFVLVVGAGALATASAHDGTPTAPGPHSDLASSPTPAAPLTPAASPSPLLGTSGGGSWDVNGATVKAAGALATEIDSSGNNLKLSLGATHGAWAARFAISGIVPIDASGTVTGPGPVLDVSIDAFGMPVSVQGTPGKDLSVTVGHRSSQSSLLDYAVPVAAVSAPAPRTDGPQQVVLQDGADWLRGALAFTVVGWLLLLIAPGLRGRAERATRSMPLSRFGMGIVLALDIPLVCLVVLLLGVPVGLWWLGIVGLAIFVALLVASYAYSGFQLGVLLLDRLGGPGMDRIGGRRMMWFAAVPLGMVLLTLVGEVPYVGGIISLLAVVYGLGSMLYAPREVRRAAAPAAELEGAPVEPLPAPGRPLVE
jgi:hypothetical protein